MEARRTGAERANVRTVSRPLAAPMLRLSRENRAGAGHKGVSASPTRQLWRKPVSHLPEPANGNDPGSTSFSWATWPIAGFTAWSVITTACLRSSLDLQRAWLEAGHEALRRQQAAMTKSMDDEATAHPPVLVATIVDLRECGAAVVQAQAEVLESWRHSA
jgi:hypothetical protein